MRAGALPLPRSRPEQRDPQSRTVAQSPPVLGQPHKQPVQRPAGRELVHLPFQSAPMPAGSQLQLPSKERTGRPQVALLHRQGQQQNSLVAPPSLPRGRALALRQTSLIAAWEGQLQQEVQEEQQLALMLLLLLLLGEHLVQPWQRRCLPLSGQRRTGPTLAC